MKFVAFFACMSALILAVACDNKSTATNAAASSTAPEINRTLNPVIHDRVGAATIQVTVDESGFRPSSMTAQGGRPVSLTITRISEDTCAKEVVFPSLNIRKELPLNQAVQVAFDMPTSGSVAFECGMGMLKGSIVVQ